MKEIFECQAIKGEIRPKSGRLKLGPTLSFVKNNRYSGYYLPEYCDCQMVRKNLNNAPMPPLVSTSVGMPLMSKII